MLLLLLYTAVVVMTVVFYGRSLVCGLITFSLSAFFRFVHPNLVLNRRVAVYSRCCAGRFALLLGVAP